MNPKKLGDNIEIMPVEVKPNELVLFYKNNKLVGEAGGMGCCFLLMTGIGAVSGQKGFMFLDKLVVL